MRPHVEANPDDIDLVTLGTTLRRALPRLLVLTLIAGALTFLALSTIAPRYVAQAELGIVAKGGNNPFTAPTAGTSAETLSTRMDEKAVNTHVRAIQSTDLLETVAKELRLAGRPEFNPVLGPVDTFSGILRAIGLSNPQASLSEQDRVLNEIAKRLVVYAPKDSRAITISFTSIDPQLAADFANLLANAYRSKLASASVAETTAVQDKLAPRIAKLQDEVATEEARIADFRSSAGLHRGGSQKTPINEQQLGEVTTELTRVKSARTAAEARARSARDLMRRGNPEVIPEVQKSPLIQNLISQRVSVEREMLRRAASLKPAHPVMKQLNADLSAINRQISGEIANIVSSLDKEAFVAAEQEQSVVASLDKLKTTVAVNTTDEVELRRLEAMAEAKRSELARLQAQFEANRAGSENGAVPVEAQIITLARPPSIPSFPRKMPYSLLAALAMLLIGTAVVITAGLTRGARSAGSAIAEELPDTKASAASESLRQEIATAARMQPPVPAGPQSLAAKEQDGPGMDEPVPTDLTVVHSAEDLASHLLQTGNASSAGFRTLLASRLDSEECAANAVAIASELNAAGKKTIIIDWSLDGGGIARQLRLPTAPGFVELLKGRSSFADVVRWIPGTEVHVIASGWAFAEGPEGLDADQLNLILDALDEAYDHILLISQYQPARVLFEAIQGRFDAGILSSAANDRQLVTGRKPGTFLGFDVTDIELFRLETQALARGTAA